MMAGLFQPMRCRMATRTGYKYTAVGVAKGSEALSRSSNFSWPSEKVPSCY